MVVYYVNDQMPHITPLRSASVTEPLIYYWITVIYHYNALLCSQPDNSISGSISNKFWPRWCLTHWGLWRFKKLRALKFAHYIIIVSFQCIGGYFVRNFIGILWNSTQRILPIHWEMCSWLRSEHLIAPSSHSLLTATNIQIHGHDYCR